MTDSFTANRRNVLKTMGAVAGAGAVAGCTTYGDSNDDTEGAYSVTMEPVGTVEFDEVPETWYANNGSWADMGIALGQQPPEGVWLPSRYHTQYYDEIPGVSVDKSDMTALYQDGVSEEQFYDPKADVNVIDPNFLMNRFKGWSQEKIDRVANQSGPFFGNSIFSTGYDWHEDYPYLSLYEAFGKLAELFQQQERYDAFVDLHEQFQSNVEEIVPSESERPSVAIMWAGAADATSFSPYLIGEGTSFKQWRDLGVRDAFDETSVRDFHDNRGSVDYETLLEIDPDVLLFRGHENQTREEFQNGLVAQMESDDTAQKLTAVQNGDVYRGGPLYQGPITNLVVTERAAEQVYGVEASLFDAERVAEIVDGDL
ncbi:ferrichrome-binding protein [Natronoarchaeum philippinense]|uniref:Ferrichrome-binding protein n=1 Tax=Natronoarchaeum philippinense TaxID=558529 RepID=A0A285P3G4_NATPI|nr:ABC transporter substrate-binding protein [Natronoarchaeum philippinense]SNZ16289.1 ferrichrome-binding protein [Natronoarchaeum philippinense]